jgi:hypothetical protein
MMKPVGTFKLGMFSIDVGADTADGGDVELTVKMMGSTVFQRIVTPSGTREFATLLHKAADQAEGKTAP